METNKQICGNKRISFFFLAGLLILFVILSFSSINNVYGSDSEIIFGKNDENYLDNDLDELDNNTNNDIHNVYNNNLVLENDSEYRNDSIESNDSNDNESSNGTNNINIGSPNSAGGVTVSTSSNGHSVSKLASLDNTHFSKATSISFSANHSSISNLLSPNFYHSNYNNELLYGDYGGGNAFYPLNKKDSLEKIGENSIKAGNRDFNSFFSAFSYNSNYNEYTDSNIYNDNYFINPPLVILISNSNLDFKGTSIEKYNNFLNEISNLEFNKIAINEDISVIKSLESRPNPIFSALFFITIFMEHHDNGKEPLNSF